MKHSFRKNFWLVSCLVIILSGCSSAVPNTPTLAGSEVSQATALPATSIPLASALPVGTQVEAQMLNMETLQNFLYVSEFGHKGLIPLKDGTFEWSSQNANERITSHLLDPVAFGDLNDDGLQDAAVLLATNTGGSGTFVSLFVILDTERGPVQAAAYFIDDRPLINSVSIRDGILNLDFVGHAAEDPMCCPTLHLLSSYRLRGTGLEELDRQTLP